MGASVRIVPEITMRGGGTTIDIAVIESVGSGCPETFKPLCISSLIIVERSTAHYIAVVLVLPYSVIFRPKPVTGRPRGLAKFFRMSMHDYQLNSGAILLTPV